ncbi:glycerol-3-phosphate 1-O-acyltransferase PlsY [Starkeya sp. ORNL1]|uniref:glycerol-3-phosphate 1-O-acyltransferase PlsY n=1 Tax=Starkeya sp. ORNL1 TaxID=2709380 RepID=UPI001463E686|nr:glycerol-3-phosphate 1-O-acyltransferase PlsY [Starkeya sp. ORNL1]QJP12925.1 glycerol-3-phosphate 1-O-acyltransferase PlsY [Starkeya sp. ORNL1]
MTWSLPALLTFLSLALGYLLGSIPFGLIITRLAGTQDIRTIGSGNIGATNVLRTGRKGLAAATLVGDALKGVVAVLVARALWGEQAALLAGLAAFLGHVFPVWLHFKGGKGVATFLGVALGLFWPAAIAFAVVWLSCAKLTRYSSLSALIASVAAAIAAYLLGNAPAALLLGLLAVLIWITHRANIARLIAGTEGKIGGKA